MAYHPKHRYKSRKERYVIIKRNTKIFLVFFLVALLIMIYRNRIYIIDTLRIYF